MLKRSKCDGRDTMCMAVVVPVVPRPPYALTTAAERGAVRAKRLRIWLKTPKRYSVMGLRVAHSVGTWLQ